MADSKQIGSLVVSELVVAISQPALNVNYVVTGFADGTACEIERGEAAWSHKVGTHGHVERSHNIDETATVTLHIQQTASDNDVLYGLYNYDKKQLTGDGLFTIAVLDKSGRTALFSTQAFIAVLPNQQFGTETSAMDWKIIMPYSDWYVGGNSKAGAEVQNTLSQLGYEIDDNWKIN